MSDKSPLFVSALELLAHATELYASGHPRKYKFVILHLANSVELILKDCLIDNGISIYKNPKETMTIWSAIEAIDKLGMVIPEKPIIELLIDDRNTIQHRFGFPNAEAVFYYLEQVVQFFVRFLDSHYKMKLSEVLDPYLSKDNLALIGLVKDDYYHLRKLFELSPEAALQQAYALIEVKLRDVTPLDELTSVQGKGIFTKVIGPKEQLAKLIKRQLIPLSFLEDFEKIRVTRNIVAHMASANITKTEWNDIWRVAIDLLGALDKLDETDASEDKLAPIT